MAARYDRNMIHHFQLSPYQAKIFDALVKKTKITITGGYRGGKKMTQDAADKWIRGQRINLIIIDEVDGLNLDKIKPKISLDSPRQV